MEAVLETVGWKPGDVELVAVTIGPGSFTGLRVGLATAKTFAYAVGARMLGVDTLETIAAGVPGDVAAVSAVIDAQRGRGRIATFRPRPGRLASAQPGRKSFFPSRRGLQG